MIDLDLVEPVENIPNPVRFSPLTVVLIILGIVMVLLAGSIPLSMMAHYTPPAKPRPANACGALTWRPAC